MRGVGDEAARFSSRRERRVMSEFFGQATKEIYDKLYGPKFCAHCNKVQPIIVHKLGGSDYVRKEDMKITVGFTGSQTCSVCYRPIGVSDERDERTR